MGENGRVVIIRGVVGSEMDVKEEREIYVYLKKKLFFLFFIMCLGGVKVWE